MGGKGFLFYVRRLGPCEMRGYANPRGRALRCLPYSKYVSSGKVEADYDDGSVGEIACSCNRGAHACVTTVLLD